MTKTRETPATPKSTGRKAAADAARTTVTKPDATPTTTVVERRSGISPGILIGAIAAALLGGLLIGGGTGALIMRTIDLGNRPGIGQLQQGQNGPQAGGIPGQQQGGPQGGHLGGPEGGPQQGQNGPQQQGESDDSNSDDGTDTATPTPDTEN